MMKKFKIEGLFTWRDRKPKNAFVFQLNWGSKYIILDMSKYINFLCSSFFIIIISYSIENIHRIKRRKVWNNDTKHNYITPTKILEFQKYINRRIVLNHDRYQYYLFQETTNIFKSWSEWRIFAINPGNDICKTERKFVLQRKF